MYTTIRSYEEIHMTGYVLFRSCFWKFRNISLVTAIGNWTVVFLTTISSWTPYIKKEYERTWIPFIQRYFVLSLVEKNIFFKISSMYFCYFVIISPWKRAGPFIWTNLIPHHPMIDCNMFGWNWPVFRRRRFLNFSMYFCYFIIIFPWKKAELFISTNLNSLYPRMLSA